MQPMFRRKWRMVFIPMWFSIDRTELWLTLRYEVFTMNFPHVRKRIALKKERLVFQRTLVDSENWVVYHTGILKWVENISQIYIFWIVSLCNLFFIKKNKCVYERYHFSFPLFFGISRTCMKVSILEKLQRNVALKVC